MACHRTEPQGERLRSDSPRSRPQARQEHSPADLTGYLLTHHVVTRDLLSGLQPIINCGNTRAVVRSTDVTALGMGIGALLDLPGRSPETAARGALRIVIAPLLTTLLGARPVRRNRRTRPGRARGMGLGLVPATAMAGALMTIAWRCPADRTR